MSNLVSHYKKGEGEGIAITYKRYTRSSNTSQILMLGLDDEFLQVLLLVKTTC